MYSFYLPPENTEKIYFSVYNHLILTNLMPGKSDIKPGLSVYPSKNPFLCGIIPQIIENPINDGDNVNLNVIITFSDFMGKTPYHDFHFHWTVSAQQ